MKHYRSIKILALGLTLAHCSSAASQASSQVATLQIPFASVDSVVRKIFSANGAAAVSSVRALTPKQYIDTFRLLTSDKPLTLGGYSFGGVRAQLDGLSEQISLPGNIGERYATMGELFDAIGMPKIPINVEAALGTKGLLEVLNDQARAGGDRPQSLGLIEPNSLTCTGLNDTTAGLMGHAYPFITGISGVSAITYCTAAGQLLSAAAGAVLGGVGRGYQAVSTVGTEMVEAGAFGGGAAAEAAAGGGAAAEGEATSASTTAGLCGASAAATVAPMMISALNSTACSGKLPAEITAANAELQAVMAEQTIEQTKLDKKKAKIYDNQKLIDKLSPPGPAAAAPSTSQETN